jgi:hypothetical protein
MSTQTGKANCTSDFDRDIVADDLRDVTSMLPARRWQAYQPREDVEKAASLLVALSNAQFATVEENASLRPFDTMEQIGTEHLAQLIQLDPPLARC